MVRSCFTKHQFMLPVALGSEDCFRCLHIFYLYFHLKTFTIKKYFLFIIIIFFLSKKEQTRKNLVKSISVLKCIVIAVLCFNCCCQNYQLYEKMRLLLCSSRAELKWVALFIISLQLCSDALEVKLSGAEP